jgi:Nineteen complex-related protein 2
LRSSFGPSTFTTDDDDDSLSSEVFTPKKSALSRKAIEKNARSRLLPLPPSADRGSNRSTEDRPSYSREALNELRSSTPSTPKDLTGSDFDIASKFGSTALISETTSSSSHIPTESEIREKKERRARLAKESDFISLHGDSDGAAGQVSLLPRKSKPESRLVRDDEDLAEGFEEFVDDGRIALGKKAEREQARRKKAEIANMIGDAEGSSNTEDSSSIDGEGGRQRAYDLAQLRAGTYGSTAAVSKGDHRSSRPKTPPRITPLPDLSETVQRLQDTLARMEEEKKQQQKAMAGIQAQKKDILSRELEIQRLLKEKGDEYERLREETGLAAGVNLDSAVSGENGGHLLVSRGLESIGHSQEAST